MGRAIVRSPGIFLFDEPLSNLDAKLRVHMRGEIKDLHHRLGTTSIYVTHDQVEAMTMGDRIVVMNQGVIEQIGHPLDVFDKPKNLFVAGFVGSPAMNLLTGKMGIAGDHAVFRRSDELSVPMPQAAAKYNGRAVTLGIRPHQLGIDLRGGFEAEVRDIQPTGVETILLCRLAGQDGLVQTTERITGKAGDRIRLSMNTGNLHLFDTASGERLEV